MRRQAAHQCYEGLDRPALRGLARADVQPDQPARRAGQRGGDAAPDHGCIRLVRENARRRGFVPEPHAGQQVAALLHLVGTGHPVLLIAHQQVLPGYPIGETQCTGAAAAGQNDPVEALAAQGRHHAKTPPVDAGKGFACRSVLGFGVGVHCVDIRLILQHGLVVAGHQAFDARLRQLPAQRLQQRGGADQIADVVAAYEQQLGAVRRRHPIFPLPDSG